MKAIPSRFSLNVKFEQPDYVPTDFNLLLERDARSQEVSNCWTYPTIFSFETDLIRKGLADQNIRGNEWSLSTLHTNSLRGWDVSIAPDAGSPDAHYLFQNERNWGGMHWFGLQYFATGKSGAMNETSDRDIGRIDDLLKFSLSGADQNQRWPITKDLAATRLMPDSTEERSYGYDQAKIAITTEGTKKILSNDRIAGYLSYFIDPSEALNFHAYSDFQPKAARGDKGEWFTPSSFSFRDEAGKEYRLNELLDQFKISSSLSSDQFNNFVQMLSDGSGDGGGHAVTVIGWDDKFKPSLVDKTDEFIGLYLKNVDKQFAEISADEKKSIKTLIQDFADFLKAEKITFTNSGAESRGAWIIQNSWGNQTKQIVRQYLPYDMTDLTQGETKDFDHSIYSGAMFHYADASRSFGDVHSSTTAVPSSKIFNTKGLPGYGIAYRFESSGTPLVAIGSILMANPEAIGSDGKTTDPRSKKLTDDQFVRARLWNADELIGKDLANVTPIAQTPFYPSFYGYQSLEFDAPINIVKGEQIIATFEYYADASASSPLKTDYRFAAYEFNEELENFVADVNNRGVSASDPEFYESIPVPLLHPASSSEIQDDTYFSIEKQGERRTLVDIGASGELVHLNVIHEKNHNLDESFSDGSNSFEILGKSRRGVSVGVSENRDFYESPSKRLKETFFISSANNKLFGGGLADVFMATESSGKKNLFDSGAGADTLILSLGPNNAFKGRLRLEGADGDRLIIRGQKRLNSRLRSEKGQIYYDITYPGTRIKAFVENKKSDLNIETDFSTDVTELLEIGV